MYWVINIQIHAVRFRYNTVQFDTIQYPGIILCMCPANGRPRYTVTSSIIGWTHTQNDPWTLHTAQQWWKQTIYPPLNYQKTPYFLVLMAYLLDIYCQDFREYWLLLKWDNIVFTGWNLNKTSQVLSRYFMHIKFGKQNQSTKNMMSYQNGNCHFKYNMITCLSHL